MRFPNRRCWLHGCAAIARCCLVVAVLLALAGCARAEFGSEFDEDGAATHSILFVVDRASLDAASIVAVDDRLDEVEQQATEDGLQVFRIDTDREMGLRISATTGDSEDVGAGLNALINSVAIDLTAGPIAPFSGTFSSESGAVGGSAFQLNMLVDGGLLTASVAELIPPAPAGSAEGELDDLFHMSYVVVMPGRITETNGALVRSNSVRWVIPDDGVLTMTAESKPGEPGSVTWLIVLSIGGVIAIALLSIVIGMVILKRRRRAVAASQAGQAPAADVVNASAPEVVIEVGANLGRAIERVVSGEQVVDVVDNPNAPRDESEK